MKRRAKRLKPCCAPRNCRKTYGSVPAVPARLRACCVPMGHNDPAATDIVDYQTEDQDDARRDFLMETRLPPGIEMLCSNVPFKLASQFAAHALSFVPRRVALLLRLSFLESGTEKSAAGRARLQVLDSGHLARVHVFRNRLPMMHRDGWTGNRVSNPTPYAWFIWNRDYRGPATLSRISWTPDARTPPARDTGFDGRQARRWTNDENGHSRKGKMRSCRRCAPVWLSNSTTVSTVSSLVNTGSEA